MTIFLLLHWKCAFFRHIPSRKIRGNNRFKPLRGT
nr:MAG TPA: Integrin alpha-IIb, Integrin beta-3, transmembrane signaling, protein structure [Caudoviricetes sp.]